MRVCICATQLPFAYGGAEIHVDGLRRALVERGFDTDVVTLPFSAASRMELIKSSLAWRLMRLRPGDGGAEIDLVIATRFPSYLIEHPNKVVWLIHQHRAAYDLLGTAFSDFTGSREDRRVLQMIRSMDQRTLGEARALYANSRNTAQRLQHFNNLRAEALYPPPKLDGSYRCDEFGDYLFAVGRLDPLKRFDLLLDAMRHTSRNVRCLIAGSGPERDRLAETISRCGLADRVELLGWIDDERLVELYAGCFATYYAPYDEDYGYVTIEAFKSGKAVITADDSGGVLEFVVDGENGFVCPARSPRAIGRRIDELFVDRERARSLGAAGAARVRQISWDHVVNTLTGKVQAHD